MTHDQLKAALKQIGWSIKGWEHNYWIYDHKGVKKDLHVWGEEHIEVVNRDRDRAVGVYFFLTDCSFRFINWETLYIGVGNVFILCTGERQLSSVEKYIIKKNSYVVLT